MKNSAASMDSSPKWFTEVDLDLRSQWSESTIEYVPNVHYDDSAFTRVVIASVAPPLTPYATPGA
jgi:hypothetical protein